MNKRKRQKRKENRVMDAELSKSYSNWEPINDLHRSFFVWRGPFTASMKEMEVRKVLKSHNLRFYAEVSFDLRRRFDFYIPLLDLVIEYDGAHHFDGPTAMLKDLAKEGLLIKLGVKLIRYNKTHDLKKQIQYDLIHHPVLKY
jgi:very-short-patch-repair endonuclease